MPNKTYKEMIRRRIKEKALEYLKNKVQRKNLKGKEISYEKLVVKNYY